MADEKTNLLASLLLSLKPEEPRAQPKRSQGRFNNARELDEEKMRKRKKGK